MNNTTVDILIEGFADETTLADCGTARYRPTIVLVRSGSSVIVVDPGTVERQNDIVDALAVHGVAVSDVTHVIHTHHHLDHTRNTGMFADIPVVDAWATWNRLNYATAAPLLPEGIRIEKTPGHTYDSLTVFVDTADGVVAICGDVMWWEGDTQSDVYAENIEVLRETRVKVLADADIVIPGHGARFSIKK